VITVREMINPSDPVRNVIISMSDLHLNSIWCHKEGQRIVKFIDDLTKISKVRMKETSVFITTDKKKFKKPLLLYEQETSVSLNLLRM